MFRFYTSIELAKALLEKHKMTIVGTLANNRKGLPVDFKSKNRPEGDYLPLFDPDGPTSIHSWIVNKPGIFLTHALAAKIRWGWKDAKY
jgi:hypothetical protein